MNPNSWFQASVGMALLALSCMPPSPQPPPPADADAGPGDIFDQACASLRHLGCSEGFDRPGEASCADTMRRAETAHLSQMQPDCVRRATSVTVVRSCGRYCATVLPDGTQ